MASFQKFNSFVEAVAEKNGVSSNWTPETKLIPTKFAILQEDGFNLLQESGSRIMLETGIWVERDTVTSSWTNKTPITTIWTNQ